MNLQNAHLHKEISVISNSYLGQRVATLLNANLVIPDIKVFSDGESRITLPKIKSKICLVIQSLYPSVDKNVLQTLMMIKKCNEERIDEIYAILPYLAYSRQDREFLDGEIVSAKFIAQLFEDVGTTKLLTVDVHSQLSLSYFSIPIKNVSAIPLLAKFALSNLELQDPIVVSPDLGGIKRAEDLANELNTISFFLKKKRDKQTGMVSMDEKLEMDITNRDIILIDDIISTGNSIIKAKDILIKSNPRKIYALCTHALLIGDAIMKIKESGIELISTNTIPNKFAKVDIGELISQSIPF